MFESVPNLLKHDTLTWIHSFGFIYWNTKKGCIKSFYLFNKSTKSRTDLSLGSRIRVIPGFQVPSVGRSLSYRIYPMF